MNIMKAKPFKLTWFRADTSHPNALLDFLRVPVPLTQTKPLEDVFQVIGRIAGFWMDGALGGA